MPFLGCASEILPRSGYARELAHYLFNFVERDAIAVRKRRSQVLRKQLSAKLLAAAVDQFNSILVWLPVNVELTTKTA